MAAVRRLRDERRGRGNPQTRVPDSREEERRNEIYTELDSWYQEEIRDFEEAASQRDFYLRLRSKSLPREGWRASSSSTTSGGSPARATTRSATSLNSRRNQRNRGGKQKKFVSQRSPFFRVGPTCLRIFRGNNGHGFMKILLSKIKNNIL